MRILVTALALGALSGCGSSSQPQSATDNAADVAQDPYGATGAPGADLTDNGANDGASGLADGNAANSADAGGNAQ